MTLTDPDAAWLSPAPLSPELALARLSELARHADPSLEPDVPHVRQALEALVARVGGTPAAIAALAHRLADHSPAQLLDALQLPPTLPPLLPLPAPLTPQELSALRELLPFAQSFSAEDAAQLTSFGAAQLESLRERSLIDSHLAAGRYTLRWPLREALLWQEPLPPEAQLAHATHYVARAEQGADGATWSPHDTPNLELALARASALHDHTLAARAGLALFSVCRHVGPYQHLLDLLERVVAMGLEPLAPRLQATLLGRIGELHRVLGELERAEASLTHAITLAREHLPDETLLGGLLMARSVSRRLQIASTRAEHDASEALALYERLERPDLARDAWVARASCAVAQRQFARAMPIFERLLRDDPDDFLVRNNAGGCLLAAGRLDAARLQLTRALEDATRHQHMRSMMHALNNLAMLELNAHRTEEAARLLAQTDALNARIQNTHSALYTETNRGLLHLLADELLEAHHTWTRVMEILPDLSEEGRLHMLAMRAATSAWLGARDEAHADLKAIDALLPSLPHHVFGPDFARYAHLSVTLALEGAAPEPGPLLFPSSPLLNILISDLSRRASMIGAPLEARTLPTWPEEQEDDTLPASAQALLATFRGGFTAASFNALCAAIPDPPPISLAALIQAGVLRAEGSGGARRHHLIPSLLSTHEAKLAHAHHFARLVMASPSIVALWPERGNLTAALETALEEEKDATELVAQLCWGVWCATWPAAEAHLAHEPLRHVLAAPAASPAQQAARVLLGLDPVARLAPLIEDGALPRPLRASLALLGAERAEDPLPFLTRALSCDGEHLAARVLAAWHALLAQRNLEAHHHLSAAHEAARRRGEEQALARTWTERELTRVEPTRREAWRALYSRLNPTSASSSPHDTAPADLTLGDDAMSVQLADGTLYDMRRRGTSRRLLLALVAQHGDQAGAPLSAEALFEAGWPGESLTLTTRSRFHTAIHRLREQILGEHLLTQDDGYLIDPNCKIATQREM